MLTKTAITWAALWSMGLLTGYATAGLLPLFLIFTLFVVANRLVTDAPYKSAPKLEV